MATKPLKQKNVCEYVKPCKVRDCHNGFIPRWIGGVVFVDDCECKCHKKK